MLSTSARFIGHLNARNPTFLIRLFPFPGLSLASKARRSERQSVISLASREEVGRVFPSSP
jgi:hypothetical protein